MLFFVRPRSGDILFVDNYFASVPALLIRVLKRRVLIIQDIRELYSTNDAKSLKGKLFILSERRLMRLADVVICANGHRAVYMKETFNLPSLPLVFENIRFLTGEVNDSIEHFERIDLENVRFKVISTGGVSLARGALDLLKAFRTLPLVYHLFLVGGGSKEDYQIVNDYICLNNIENVTILGKVPLLSLRNIVSKCTIGVVIYPRNNINNEYCASGKVYEYVGEGLPIVTSLNPPLSELCQATNIGIASDDYGTAIKHVADNLEYYRENVASFRKSLSVDANLYNCYRSIVSKIFTDSQKS